MDPMDRSLKLSASARSVDRLPGTSSTHVIDDEAALDVDEPPDESLLFRRQPIRSPTFPGTLSITNSNLIDQKPRQQSLLTQGLLTITSPKPLPHDSVSSGPRSARSTYSTGSIASTAELTSDGGFTSPARTSTPSPPLPPTRVTLLDVEDAFNKKLNNPQNLTAPSVHPLEEPVLEQPRKRSIKFACSQAAPCKKEELPKPVVLSPTPIKRCTTLKFACPFKPSRESAQEQDKISSRADRSLSPAKQNREETSNKELGLPGGDVTPKKVPTNNLVSSGSPTLAKKKPRSEALRFHEFASPRLEEDEWTQVKPVHQHKLTVNDTLKKENAIRKLAEEAEAEALEEENEAEEDDANSDANDDDEIEDDFSNDGNESDDEEGFAASDDESETNSEYQFWTPGVTTAATSTDQLEHIRPKQRRSASESSIESTIYNNGANIVAQTLALKSKHSRRIPKTRPLTPELPDSTDFVCGTLDEDRPLEEAYMSCLEQRKRSKHGITPQDVDPSFPTSDPEDEDSDNDGDEGHVASDNLGWVVGKPDESDAGYQRGRPGHDGRTSIRSPSISPKRKVSPAPRRLKSPAPMATKRGNVCRSPPPRRLFGQSPKRLQSPPPRHLLSPPSSRRPSYNGKSIAVPRLAQRSNLTHTKSLPRTPNPFWQEHRRLQMKSAKLRFEGPQRGNNVIRSRGPIDIVQGLEKKRQRRKEKFWLTHCRNGTKERRCQPGKGAERMREVGLEMADRCKGYGQRVPLVLSV
ncbi:hypothetical protein MMC10_009631 [Thelotrema lepadinum]|nr:hypothetical protein [Thelotrema lepadinum]